MQPNNMIDDADLAQRIGELLCDAHYHDLSRQKPLSVVDKGSYWRVEGNWNRGGIADGPAEFFLSVDKSNGRVMDIGELERYTPHPSVIPVISEQLARLNVEQAATIQSFEQLIELNENSDPDKSGVGMLLLTQMSHGGVVFSADLAIKIGEAFYELQYGDPARQTSLRAEDKETFWRIEGRWSSDKKTVGAGRLSLCIDKYDGKLTLLGLGFGAFYAG